MATKKKQKKAKEPDLFTEAKKQKIAKPKEWKFPGGVRYADVKPGDIFIFSNVRDWMKDGKITEMRGEVISKGTIDAKSKYFQVKIFHPDLESIGEDDIRRFIITKK